jgi:hypothetical protein
MKEKHIKKWHGFKIKREREKKKTKQMKNGMLESHINCD